MASAFQLREPDTGERCTQSGSIWVSGSADALGTTDDPDLRFCIVYRDTCDPSTQP
ncbi:hypothetical protein [Nocardia fluminea]|uniref:hypothetical protein n=1 Tax=Nocardia fluminea TaxID=134984 RepID=UPI003D10A6D4